jgi:hypothetical protein
MCGGVFLRQPIMTHDKTNNMTQSKRKRPDLSAYPEEVLEIVLDILQRQHEVCVETDSG